MKRRAVFALFAIFLFFCFIGTLLWMSIKIPRVGQVVAQSIGPLGGVGLTAVFVVLTWLPTIKRTGRVPRWPLLCLIVFILAAIVFVVNHAAMV